MVITHESISYYQKSLQTSSKAQEYLRGRGVTTQGIAAFEIGFDPAENRIVLPILDYGGALIAWTRRTIVNRGPRYLHSLGFRSSRFLFGLHLPCEGTPILVEGPLDAILLRQLGYAAYAIFGMKVSVWQAALCVPLAKDSEVTIYPDHDAEDEAIFSHHTLSKLGLRGQIVRYGYPLFCEAKADPAWLAQEDPEFLLAKLEETNNTGG